MRGKAESAAVPPAIVPAPRLAPSEASRRWAALLQQIFEVDPLACPVGHGAMRIVAFITQTSVIDQILTHLRTRAAHAAHAGARKSPIDPGAGRARCPATPRGGTPSPLYLTPTRQSPRAGFNGRLTGASDRSPPASPPPTTTAVRTALEAR